MKITRLFKSRRTVMMQMTALNSFRNEIERRSKGGRTVMSRPSILTICSPFKKELYLGIHITPTTLCSSRKILSKICIVLNLHQDVSTSHRSVVLAIRPYMLRQSFQEELRLQKRLFEHDGVQAPLSKLSSSSQIPGRTYTSKSNN